MKETTKPLYYVHAHLMPDSRCFYLSDYDGYTVQFVPCALEAKAVTKTTADEAVSVALKLGAPIIQSDLIPCDSTKLLTDKMRKTLNLTT